MKRPKRLLPEFGMSGFTLIEMAFVLVIVGMMVGGGLIAINPLLDKIHTSQTNASFDQLENALILFAIKNNRLPCPANGALNNSSLYYGLENGGSAPPVGGAACGVGANAVPLANSVIPWRTLGLDENQSLDGWGNRISYFPANSQITGVNSLVDNSSGVTRTCGADNTGVSCNLCLSRSIGVVNASTRASLCDIATAGLSPSYPYGNYLAVYSVSAGACSTELTSPNTNNAAAAFNGGADNCAGVTASVAVTANNVNFDGARAAYVLISHGRSGWYGWNRNGNQNPAPAPTRVLKQFNSNASAGTAGNLGFVQGPSILIMNSANYFDDILRWRSPSFLIQVCGSTSCGNP